MSRLSRHMKRRARRSRIEELQIHKSVVVEILPDCTSQIRREDLISSTRELPEVRPGIFEAEGGDQLELFLHDALILERIGVARILRGTGQKA